MNSLQLLKNCRVNHGLLKWTLFIVLSYCTLIVAELEPKDDEETNPTLVSTFYIKSS